MNTCEPTFLATILLPEDFDMRRAFALLAVVALVLFLGFFNRLANRLKDRQSTTGKIVAALNRRIPSRFISLTLRYGGSVMLGLLVGWALTSASNSRRFSRVIAMQRSLFAHRLHTNGLPAAASVVVEQGTNGIGVKIELEMTSPYGTGYRTIDLGRAASLEEVTGKWGFMDWREDGLHVGRGTNEFFLPREELESGGR